MNNHNEAMFTTIVLTIGITLTVSLVMGCLFGWIRNRLFGANRKSRVISQPNTNDAVNRQKFEYTDTVTSNNSSNLLINDRNKRIDQHTDHEHIVAKEITESFPQTKIIVSDSDSVRHKREETTEVSIDNDFRLSSFDHVLETCQSDLEALEKLEHVLKSRPRRSGIRRSTRKSRMPKADNKEINTPDSSEPEPDYDEQSEHKTKDRHLISFADSGQSSTNNASGNAQEFNESKENDKPNVIGRAKKIGSPMMNAALFAELKKKQNHKFQNNQT